VLSDILTAIDRGDLAALVLLDLSALGSLRYRRPYHSLTALTDDVRYRRYSSQAVLVRKQYVRRGPDKSSVARSINSSRYSTQLRPRHHNHWCIHQPSPVAGPRAHTVPIGCSGVQGPTWRRAIIPWFTRPRRWSSWSTSAAFCWLQPSCRATSRTVYSRQSSLSGRHCSTLEQLAS